MDIITFIADIKNKTIIDNKSILYLNKDIYNKLLYLDVIKDNKLFNLPIIINENIIGAEIK